VVSVMCGSNDGAKRELIEGFVDSAGHRRGVDAYFLTHLCGVRALPDQRPRGSDVEFWDAVVREEGAGLLAGLSAGAHASTRGVREETGHDTETAPAWVAAIDGEIATDARALAPAARMRGVEVWTEVELCCLHALSMVPGGRERCELAARWLVEELQPDNATQHPWGVHVFAAMGAMRDAGADHYAQTLFHNALMSNGGKAEIFSGLLLWDGARWLDRVCDRQP
jgi:chorismate mutase